MDTAEHSYPLSPVQEGMLFHRVQSAHSGVDIEQMVATLHEPIDTDAFALAWQRVVAHHPALRTRFRWDGLDRPVQEVLRSVDIALVQEDWSAFGPEECSRRLSVFLKNDRLAGIDLAAPPLLRLRLFRYGEADHRLVWTFPHILLDGGSFPTVVRQVFAAYAAIRGGGVPELEASRPYGDHIAWLGAEIAAKKAEAAAFFRRTLSGFGAANELPAKGADADRGAPSDRLYGERELKLSRALTSQLAAVALKSEATINTCVQAAWALVLADFSGDDDVVFGVVRACRRTALPEADRMVGLFINTVPLRIGVRDDLSVTSWLKEIRDGYSLLRPFEHTPLVESSSESDVPRGTPLFHTIIVFNDARMGSK